MIADNHLYEQPISQEDREKYQLKQLNKWWTAYANSVPYLTKNYASAIQSKGFSSWEQFRETMPVLSKAFVQENILQLTSSARRPQKFLSTGGSTYAPVRIPAWQSEDTIVSKNIWRGRSWIGIQSGEKAALIWGHAHILGTGWRGYKNRVLRIIKDHTLGYRRYSAYDLSESATAAIAADLTQFKPSYLIGYSSALELFARRISKTIKLPKLTAVIATAESFSSDSSREIVSSAFGSPVYMEYGTVETGPIAYEVPEGGYRAFWDAYFLETAWDPSLQAEVLCVTSLYPKAFPLLRYSLGDQIEGQRSHGGIANFNKVLGRGGDIVELLDGSLIHAEAFSHVIRNFSEVARYQVVSEGQQLCIVLCLRESWSPEAESRLRSQLAKVHPLLEQVTISVERKIEQTIAGKCPLVLRRP